MARWLALAGGAAILIACGSLCAKWSQTMHISILDYVTGYMLVQALVAALMWAVLTQTRGGRRALEGSPLWAGEQDGGAPPARRLCGWPQLLTGIIFVIVSLLAVAAVQQAPNPGYASSVVSTSALLVALAAPLLFPSASLTSSAFAGLLLVAAGITVVSLSSASNHD